MDVFIVSSVRWRDGASVIGAAGDLDGAQAIAARAEYPDESVRGWSDWHTDRRGRDGVPLWTRDALMPGDDPSLSQEIVQVPLTLSAGAIGKDVLENIKAWAGPPTSQL